MKWVRERGVESIAAHERGLVQTFIDATLSLDGLTIHGPQGVADRLGVFSVTVEGYEPHELSSILEFSYGLLTRSGVHCAPFVHKTLGTVEGGGTTRLSFGPFTSKQDVRYAADALAQVAQSALVIA